MKKEVACEFFWQPMNNTNTLVITEESKGDYCVAQKNDKYHRQLKASLRAKVAKSSIAPSAARLGFFDQKLPTSVIPTQRQISRSRSSITSQTRIDAPGESPAELSEMVDSMVRRNGSCPSTVYTLPDFSKVDEKKTIVPFTCDVMLAAAQKYIAQGVSVHNGSHTRVIRLVGDATHDESFQKLKILKIGLAGCHFARGE